MSRPLRLPRGAATVFWTLVFLAVLELLVREYWDPRYIDPNLFAKTYPGIDYGYALARPPCLKVEDQFQCFPTEHFLLTPHSFPAEKSKKEIRILTVGSSIGVGTSAFPQQLAYRLGIRCPRVSFTNVNLSVMGFGSARTAEMVEAGQRYAPDLILMDVPSINENVDLLARETYFREQFGAFGWLTKSQAVVVGRRLVTKFIGQPLPGLTLVPDAPYLDLPPWAEPRRFFVHEKSEIAKVVARSKQRSQPLVLIARAQLIPRRPWEIEHLAMLKGFEPEALVIDPDPDFGPHENRLQYFLDDKLHYQAEAHAIVAKKVAAEMLARIEWLKGRCAGH